MRIKESAENYLETIYMLENKNEGRVRSIDIAKNLAFSKASVSVAMKNLREGGFIIIEENGNIVLTKSGRTIAEQMYERHIILTEWLTEMGVERQIAIEDACRMEHFISKDSFEAIKGHIEAEINAKKKR